MDDCDWIDEFSDDTDCLSLFNLFADPSDLSDDSSIEFEAEPNLTTELFINGIWVNPSWGSERDFIYMPADMDESSYVWPIEQMLPLTGSFENLVVDTITITPQTLLYTDANNQIPQVFTYEGAAATDESLTPNQATVSTTTPSSAVTVTNNLPKVKKKKKSEAEKYIPLYARNSEDPNLSKKERNNIKKAQRSKAFHDRRILQLIQARETFKTSLNEREKEFEELLATIKKSGQEIRPEMQKEIDYVQNSLDDARKLRCHYKLDDPEPVGRRRVR